MQPFPSDTPAAEILEAIRRQGRPDLGPGQVRDGSWRSRLDSLSDAELLGTSTPDDRDAAACVRSGLLLFANDLDASHTISQGIKTPDGSFWHGIMHRKEQDYSNSKYWFRHVGAHPLLGELPKRLTESGSALGPIETRLCASGSWDPFALVDTVASCVEGIKPELREDLLEVQEKEMLHLLRYCYAKAVG